MVMDELLAHYLAPAPLEPLEPVRLDDEVTAEQCEAMDDVLEALV
jgi:hypothetical protein